MALKITNESAVTLDGYVDANRQLQFRYGSQELADFGDSVVVYSDDAVRVTLTSPPGSTLSASHLEGRDPVQWQAAAAGVFHSFSSHTSDPVQVDAETEPSLPKTIFVDYKPTGGLPDT